MIVKIPRSQKQLVRKYVNLSDDVRRAVVVAFEKAPLRNSLSEFTRTISEIATFEEARELAPAFIAMQMTRLQHSESATGFAEKLSMAARSDELGPQGRENDNAFWKSISVELAAILADRNSITIVAKAIDLARAGNLAFSDVRIISDIRPVFGVELGATPPAAVVLHNLTIQHLGDEGDYFVLLSKEDLKRLQKVIERALRKDEMLSETATKGGLAVFRTDEVL
jgi:hypothetical protein